MVQKRHTKDYSDPRWYEKRDRIFKRDDYCCRSCKSKGMIQAHHLVYVEGRKPWQYDDDDLITFCTPCHKRITLFYNQFRDYLRKHLKDIKQIEGIAHIFNHIHIEQHTPDQLMIIANKIKEVV